MLNCIGNNKKLITITISNLQMGDQLCLKEFWQGGQVCSLHCIDKYGKYHWIYVKFEGAQVKKREVAKDLFAIAPLILDITRNKNILLIEYDFLILLHREWAEKLHFSHFFHFPSEYLLPFSFSFFNFPFWLGESLKNYGKICQHFFHVIYNHNLRSNVPLQKNSQIANRKGGNPFGQPDRRFPISIFYPFPKREMR